MPSVLLGILTKLFPKMRSSDIPQNEFQMASLREVPIVSNLFDPGYRRDKIP